MLEGKVMPHHTSKITALVGMLVLALPLLFVNCSEVGFQNSTKSDAVIQSCQGQPDCDIPGSGDDDDDPTRDQPLPSEIVAKTLTAIVPPASDKVDILLVIDNSGSMEIERSALASRLDGFVNDLDSKGLDWRMCHTFTDKRRAIEWEGLGSSRVLTPSTPNRSQIFFDSLVDINEGSGNEQGIRRSLENLKNIGNMNCFRSDGALAIILLSDEDERSCGARSSECLNDDFDALTTDNQPETLINYVGNRWQQNKPFTFHSIVIRPSINGAPADDNCRQIQRNQNHAAYYGVEYAKVSLQTGGIVGSICSSNYANQLDLIGERIEETLDSMPLECAPYQGQITVSVVDSSGNALGNSPSLDGNKLVFSPPLPAGARVTGNYSCLEFL